MVWITNTSLPRTDSWICTRVSMETEKTWAAETTRGLHARTPSAREASGACCPRSPSLPQSGGRPRWETLPTRWLRSFSRLHISKEEKNKQAVLLVATLNSLVCVYSDSSHAATRPVPICPHAPCSSEQRLASPDVRAQKNECRDAGLPLLASW